MAAMRLGCLFSHAANIAYLHKAQSPYSVNSLAVMAAQAAVEDHAYIENYVAEVLAARELLCVGLEKLGIPYYRARRISCLCSFGDRAIEVRDALREPRRSWSATAAMRSPGACVSPSGHARTDAGAFSRSNWRKSVDEGLNRRFDMDGVLVDVTESYRETIAQTVEHFTGTTCSRELIQDYKNQGGWNNDWKLSHHIVTRAGHRRPVRVREGRTSRSLLRHDTTA